MNPTIQIVAIAVSVALLGVVIELVRRRLLAEEFSLVWLASAGLLLVASCFREGLHTVARWLGVAYPPSLLLLAVLFLVFVGLLSMSVVLTTQRNHARKLTEELAIVEARLRALEAAQSPPADRDRSAVAGDP